MNHFERTIIITVGDHINKPSGSILAINYSLSKRINVSNSQHVRLDSTSFSFRIPVMSRQRFSNILFKYANGTLTLDVTEN